MYFKYKNNNIYYEKHGNNKDVIIILPGWGDNRYTFNNIINVLKQDYSIYIFDYPGFGNSEISNNEMTIYDYSKAIIYFMKTNKIKNPIVIGHSFGGRIIITLSGLYEIKFKKIILMSSAGIKPKKNILQILKLIIYKTLKKLKLIIPKTKRASYSKKLINLFGSSDYKSIPESLRKTFINIVNENLTKYIKNIKDETLILWGQNDNITPIKDAYIMNKLIKDSGLVIIKETNHFFYLEKQNYIITVLKQYLKKED